MSTLSAIVRARIDKLGKPHKEIAAAIHTLLESGSNPPKLQTIEPKLSKLVNDDPAGWAFFRVPERLAALAAALGLAEADLKAAAEKTVLVLHPDLPKEVVQYLNARADDPGAAFSCVEVNRKPADGNAPEIRVAMRDEAKKHRAALVVLPKREEEEFFLGAEVPTTLVTTNPRGFLLEAEPELVTFPPVQAPELWKDGKPRIACSELSNLFLNVWTEPRDVNRWGRRDQEEECAARLRKLDEDIGNLYGRYALSESQRIRREYLEGYEPTYPLGSAWPYLALRHGLPKLQPDFGTAVLETDPSRVDAEFVAKLLAAEQPTRTLIWAWRGRLFAFGADSGRVQDALSEFHRVEVPPSLAVLSAAPSNVNPWRAVEQTSPNWARLKAQVADETGLDIQPLAREWRSREESTVPASPDRLTAKVLRGEPAGAVRATLNRLAERTFDSQPEHATAPLWLDRASRAPLLNLELPDGLHVLADLGGGRAMRIVIREFGEEPSVVAVAKAADYSTSTHSGYNRPIDCYTLDGSDFRAWCFPMYDELLEGPFLRPRRNAEAAEAARDAYYDDDD